MEGLKNPAKNMPEEQAAVMTVHMAPGWQPGWLNDQLIDAYLSLMEEQKKKMKKTVITGTCHTFNSIKKTGKWRSKVNLSKYSKVLIPGQFDATNHWQLCVVDLDEGTIALVDPMSLETDMDSVVFNEMREFLEKREGNKSKVEWRQKWIAHPLQIDCISCGVFILKIAECLAWDMAISSTKVSQHWDAKLLFAMLKTPK
ncbi:ubiquitin-like-specific protease 1 [Nematostella vectensis]|uniref:ubiquitin-like-specific protease 1 n=1 Tax=Nematostella vectensis TaxID=45351 RepID=UPI002076F2A5|nr:ubiquitin-like-specific protease 1 [Nematostella vectensis]